MTDDEKRALVDLLTKAEAVARATLPRNIADRFGWARDAVGMLGVGA